jgi:hypothetical protein
MGVFLFTPPLSTHVYTSPPLSEEEEIVWGSASDNHLKPDPPLKKSNEGPPLSRCKN